MICEPTVSNIRLIGCDGGDIWHLHGDNAGAEGVQIAEGGLQDLWEAPIKVIERTPIRMDGGILRAVKTEIMELVLVLVISGRHINETFGVVDGDLREAFSFELDPWFEQSTLARLEWETESSTRWLDVVLTTGSKFEADLDPRARGHWLWEVHLKAYVPFWCEEDAGTDLAVSFTAPATKTIEVANPTGVDMPQKWVCTPGQFRLPDNSWTGKRWARSPGGQYPSRTILYPNVTAAQGGLVVDYGNTDLPVRDALDTNLIAQMPVPGDYPKHIIPRFTQTQTLSVTAVQVPSGGASVMLRQPRRFRKPWGNV